MLVSSAFVPSSAVWSALIAVIALLTSSSLSSAFLALSMASSIVCTVSSVNLGKLEEIKHAHAHRNIQPRKNLFPPHEGIGR
jgi:hypothetical protein